MGVGGAGEEPQEEASALRARRAAVTGRGEPFPSRPGSRASHHRTSREKVGREHPGD